MMRVTFEATEGGILVTHHYADGSIREGIINLRDAYAIGQSFRRALDQAQSVRAWNVMVPGQAPLLRTP